MNHLSNKSSGAAGYSIVELVISSVLLAFMIGIVSTLFSDSLANFASTQQRRVNY